MVQPSTAQPERSAPQPVGASPEVADIHLEPTPEAVTEPTAAVADFSALVRRLRRASAHPWKKPRPQ